MKQTFRFGLACVLSALGGPALAVPTFQIVGEGSATDVSANGSVVVGWMLGSYETFRWTQSGGSELLGRKSSDAGTIGGTPNVSADGTRLVATIASVDTTYATAGRWKTGTGWEEILPPVPPDGAPLGGSYGSAWGVSEDGQTVVGLYWRAGQPGGSAHAFRWDGTGGVVGLGTSPGGLDSRAADADADGNVIAGWSATSQGVWQPSVWVDDTLTVLNAGAGFAEATRVSPDGSIVVGSAFAPATNNETAALWRWNGTGWDETILGQLPGTFQYYGTARCQDLTPDGSVIVGYNAYDWNNSTGFIWTPGGGMVKIDDYLADLGITVPSDVVLTGVSAISDDGQTIVGTSRDVFAPWLTRWWMLRLAEPTAAGEDPGPTARRVAFANPMRGPTAISLDLPEAGTVDLDVFDPRGRRVRSLLSAFLSGGTHTVPWDGRDDSGAPLASGVYFVRLEAGSARETRRLVLAR